jgi:hypothetical protein
MLRTRTGASVCQLVGYPGRPRGGLTNRPVSSPFPTGADPSLVGERTLQEPLAPAPSEYPLPLGHSVEKRTFVRPLSRVPLLAPFPSRPSTPWLHALQSSMCFNHTWRVRHLGPTQSLLKRWVASRSHLLLLSSRFLHPSHINSCCECRSTEPLFLRSLDPQWRLLRVLHLALSSVAPFHTLGA